MGIDPKWFETIVSNIKILHLKENEELTKFAIKYVDTYGTKSQLEKLWQVIKKPE